jgi:hypothetical protein
LPEAREVHIAKGAVLQALADVVELRSQRESRALLDEKGNKMTPCVIKPHFTCDGTGQMCNACGESSSACQCDEDEQEIVDCEECDGAARICVEHDSPCGDMNKPPQCDAAKKASKS